MTKRDIKERRAYADQRMVEAIDRMLASITESERQKQGHGRTLGEVSVEVTIRLNFADRPALSHDDIAWTAINNRQPSARSEVAVPRRRMGTRGASALVTFSIDLFRQYNDAQGQCEEDYCLRRIA